MEDVLVLIAVTLGFFAATFGIFYLFYTTRNKERMAIIEKGVSADIFNQNKKPNLTNWSLKLGLLALGIGLGLIISLPLSGLCYNEMQQITLIWGLILIFGGLGLFISHLIEKKNLKNDKSNTII